MNQEKIEVINESFLSTKTKPVSSFYRFTKMRKRMKNNQEVKQLITWALIPKGQARPRTWVKILVNPFFHKKGKRVKICKRTRMDVLPFNAFNIGDYSTIEDFSTVNNGVGNVFIGKRTRIGIGSVIIGPVTIKNDVRLAQNIVLSGLNHNYKNIEEPIHKQGVSTAPIIVEDGSWIGANSVILAGITIGKNSVVAGGSVVTKDVPPMAVVAGNPARIMKQYNPKTKQWDKTPK